MSKVPFAMIATLMLAACATKPVKQSEARQVPQDRLALYQTPLSGGGEITVIRDAGFSGSACYLGVVIGGTLSASLGPGEKASFQLPPGRSVLSTKGVGAGICGSSLASRAERSIEIYVDPDQHRGYRLATSASGDISINPID